LPQLDIYIFCELSQNVLVFFYIILIINTSIMLLNIFLSSCNLKLKFFVEKQLVKNTFLELLEIKILNFVKQNLNIIFNFFIYLKKLIFNEKLIDVFFFNILYFENLIKENIKNLIFLKNICEYYKKVY